MNEKRIRKGVFAVLLVAMLMMSSITVFANGDRETYADQQTRESQIDVAIKFILDGVEAEAAGFVVWVPAGYELSGTDIEDLLEVAAEELGDVFECVGVYWDEAGTIPIQTGDRIEGEATLYIFARTVENTPDPTPTPSDPDPTPTDPEPVPTPSDPVPTPTKTAPETGDTASTGWFVVVITAAVATVGVGVKHRRETAM